MEGSLCMLCFPIRPVRMECVSGGSLAECPASAIHSEFVHTCCTEHLTGENNLCILVGFSKGWFMVPSSERGGRARHREGKLVRGADPAMPAPTSLGCVSCKCGCSLSAVLTWHCMAGKLLGSLPCAAEYATRDRTCHSCDHLLGPKRWEEKETLLKSSRKRVADPCAATAMTFRTRLALLPAWERFRNIINAFATRLQSVTCAGDQIKPQLIAGKLGI